MVHSEQIIGFVRATISQCEQWLFVLLQVGPSVYELALLHLNSQS